MLAKRKVIATGVIVLMASLAACGGGPGSPSYPLPDEPGLFALGPDEELQRLDGDRNWELRSWPQRADLSPYLEFVLYDPSLGRDTRPRNELAKIWRVAWVRSEIDAGGRTLPIEGSEWAVAELDGFEVPVSYDHPQGRPDYVHIVPQQPLEPGLYSLRLERAGSDRVARFGVEWSSIDKRRYSAENCIDRYLGSVVTYRLCREQGEALEARAAEDLSITLVEPIRQSNILVVQGIVANGGNQRRRVPTMQAVLLDAQGRSLSSATVRPQTTELAPGERTSFKGEIVDPPRGTARINVQFLPTTNAGVQ